jgi:hypothetical protein
MKTWKEIPLNPEGAVQPASFNFNLGKSLNEFNGNMNGNNLPVHSVTSLNLQKPVAGTITSGAVDGFNTVMPSQAYHSIKRDYRNTGGGDIWTPLVSLDLNADNWNKGWNKLSDNSNFTDCYLQFDAREGALIGCATIDYSHGTDMIRVTSGGITVNTSVGFGWWSEWAVFVNDVMVARTGQIPPRRITVQLPFNVPIGSQPAKVDVRWMSNVSKELGVDNSFGTTFDIFSATCWTRNQYR